MHLLNLKFKVKKREEKIYQQTGSKTVQLKHTQRCLKLAKKILIYASET